MKVLLAVDLSDHANVAAKFLCRLPKIGQMEVTLITIVNPPEFGMHASTELWYPEFIEHQHEIVQAKHKQVSQLLEAAGANVQCQIGHGHIGGEIVSYAETAAVDWIAMGATGHSMIGRLLLGSVGDYVATHAKCSVMVVRPKTLLEHELLKISVAYDHSESSQKVLSEVARREWPSGTAVQLITAVAPVMVYRDDLFPSAAEEEQRRRKQAEKIATDAVASLSHFSGGAQVDVVEGEHTGEAILAAADQFSSNLVVVGDKGHGIFERLMLGSTCRYILHHAHQSVFVVR